MHENTINKPAISVILATKGNKLTLLENCLKSLEQQTFRDFEIILIYSISSAAINEIIEKYGLLAWADTSSTLGAARNLGAKNANSELIVFIDDDCEAPNEWLSKINLTFQENPQLCCLGGTHYTPSEESKKNPVSFVQGSILQSRMGERVLFGRSTVGKISGCNVAFRKAMFEKAGGLNESLRTVEDWELNIRLVENGYNLRFDPSIFVWHHRQGIKHSFWGGTKMVPFFPSFKTMKYARYDSLFASFYLSNLIFLVLLVTLILSPIVFLVILVIALLGQFAFAAVRSKTRSWRVIYYPLAILNTLAMLMGFYFGLLRYAAIKLKSKIVVTPRK